MPDSKVQWLRAVPDALDGSAVAEIDRRLSAIATTQRVCIPWAIESGSRAWGFPSPDSDYDARFIYVRSVDQYLSPWQPRDVIEMPIEGDMDVNGWDLGKAIKLMLKGNAVVTEWLQSPIIYQGDVDFRDEMLALARHCGNRINAVHHYYHLGIKQWNAFNAPTKIIPAKKLFYAARPALCLRWLRLHSDKNVPPMDFQTLLEEAETPREIADHFRGLIAAKAITRELGSMTVANAVTAFINMEYAEPIPMLNGNPIPQNAENIEMASNLFYRMASR